MSDLIKFVNRWNSGDAFQNLEYLTIELCLDAMPRNEILNAIGAKYISPTKKPPTHTLPKRFIEYVDAEPKTNPITSHTYVVRETDSFVASILIQEKTLSFGAWNKTEKEFLRMVE
ncbi:hypothetical protein B9Z55_010694 [Caenorhabditis nigoni]|uniref:F-box associated domain-containing protein n=1 Tax=Caenorhabditis nigoni TaxID=1611254 RepID=A0A2G5UHX3_9PELO|nr:hypothetical protein B9Z55_010694 [Caenorhabditis nigoni]